MGYPSIDAAGPFFTSEPAASDLDFGHSVRFNLTLILPARRQAARAEEVPLLRAETSVDGVFLVFVFWR